MRTIFRLIRMFLVVGLAGALTAATVVGIGPQVYKAVNSTSSVDADIDLNALDNYAVRSYMYASDGKLMATLHAAENRVPVTLDRIPKPVIDSILAVEDADFYQHPGVNMRGIFRALVENVSSGGNIQQGGSTITQQLVKNTFGDDELTADRKSTEMAMALRLEKKIVALHDGDVKAAKDEILERYLNTVYFGSGAYGVQAAAETYWGIDVSLMGYPEGAMLAGLIRNPVRNDPTIDDVSYENAKQARYQALDRLVVGGKITPEDAQKYGRALIPTERCGQEGSNPDFCAGLQPPPPRDYFEDQVRQRLLNDPIYGLGATPQERYQTLFGGGIKIYTTLNPAAQDMMRATYDKIVPKDTFRVKPNPDHPDPAIANFEIETTLKAGIVSVEPHTGAVRAMVGGPDFVADPFNNAIGNIGRQTGSSFKTYVLLTALEQGNVPDDYVAGGGDFPNPGGFPDPYHIAGQGGSLDAVTTQSSNGAFVRLGQIVGLDNVIKLTASMDITGIDTNLSVPLGVKDTQPIQMATAYNAIPSGGIYEPYYLIDKVVGQNGIPIYEHFGSGKRVFSAETACLATQILNHNTQYGTGTRAGLTRQPAAGKTGTTDGGADVWFVGFTPYLTTAVWMGFQEGKIKIPAIDGIANMGGFYPARIWGDFNEQYHRNLNLEPQSFPRCAPTRGGRQVVGPGDNNKNLPPPGDWNRDDDTQQTYSTYVPPPTTKAPPDSVTTPTTDEPPPTDPPPVTTGVTVTTVTPPPTTAAPTGGSP